MVRDEDVKQRAAELSLAAQSRTCACGAPALPPYDMCNGMSCESTGHPLPPDPRTLALFLKFSHHPDVLRKLIAKQDARTKFLQCAIEVKQYLQAKERAAQQKLTNYTEEDFDLMSLADWFMACGLRVHSGRMVSK